MFDTYFSARYILSKGALFNSVFSDRSDGKTFDCGQRALEDYEQDRSITIYMRRYKSELSSNIYDGFFEKPLELEKNARFRSWHFRGSKRGIQVCTDDNYKDKDAQWDWIVFFVPLTMSGKMKSSFDGYTSRIHIIDFDEYIPLDDRYAPNEMTLLIEFWKSIDRDRNITQLLVLGNRVVAYNPLFDYFGINVDITGPKVRMYRDGAFALQIYVNKEHRTKREATLFKSLVKNTPYDQYDSGGVLEAQKLKTASREGAEYFSSFKSDIGEGTIWTIGTRFIISAYRRKDGIVLVDRIHNTGREEYTITFGKLALSFRNAYKSGNLYYESMDAYRSFEPILRMIYRSA